MNDWPDPEKIAEPDEDRQALMQDFESVVAALLRGDRGHEVIVTFFLNRVSFLDEREHAFQPAFQFSRAIGFDFVVVAPLPRDRIQFGARPRRRHHARARRLDARVEVRA